MVVGYCRLSRDEDKDSYTSIESQVDLINKYAKAHHIKVEKIFIDDNYSGYKVTKYDDTLFDRPDFIEMMEWVKAGKVDTILTKDESRIGRKQSIVLLTLERFQAAKCRCLGVPDGKDILNDTSGVTTWSDEQLVKRTSEKVRGALHARQDSGTLIMGDYYGYIRVKKTRLIIDKRVAPCVQLIFDLYLQGFGYVRIARYLNEHTNYPTPSAYYQENHRKKGRTYRLKVNPVWESHHIPRILTDDVYTGILTTRKKEVIGIKGHAVRVPKDRQLKFPQHHEPIISQDIFDRVQEIRKKRDEVNYRGSTYDYVFKGFCFCTECNHYAGGLILRRSFNKPAYNCNQYVRYGRRGCSNKVISEKDLLESFKTFLVDTRHHYEEHLTKMDYKSKQREFEQRLIRAKQDQEKAESEYRTFLLMKTSELTDMGGELYAIKKTEYEKAEKELLERINRAMQMVATCEQQNLKGYEEKIKNYMSIMDEFIKSGRPDRRILEQLIDRILFHKGGIVEFKLKVEIPE